MLARINRFAPLGFGPAPRSGASVFHALEQEMDQWLRNLDSSWHTPRLARVGPTLDVTEEENAFSVRVEVPGYSDKDLNIAVEQDRLVVSGEIKTEAKDGEKAEVTSSFRRELSLNNLVDESQASAKLENGVLTLTLPKIKPPEPRQIAIKTK